MSGSDEKDLMSAEVISLPRDWSFVRDCDKTLW